MGAAESIIEVTKEQVHNASDLIHSVSHTIVEKAEHIKENVTDTAQAVTEKLHLTSEHAQQTATETVADVKSKIVESKPVETIVKGSEMASEAIKETIAKGTQVASDAISGTSVTVSSVLEKAGISLPIGKIPTPPPLPTKEQLGLHLLGKSLKIQKKIPQVPIFEDEKPTGAQIAEEIKQEYPVLPKLPTVPEEVVDQPVVIALDVPHEWKKADQPIETSTNAWTDPAKTKEIIHNLEIETEKSEEHIKEILQEQPTTVEQRLVVDRK